VNGKWKWKATFEVYYTSIDHIYADLKNLDDPPASKLKSAKIEELKEGEA